jgi:hypothetical protein
MVQDVFPCGSPFGRALKLSNILRTVGTKLTVFVSAEDLHLAGFSCYASIGRVNVCALL